MLFPDSFRTLPGFQARRALETLCGAGPIATLKNSLRNLWALLPEFARPNKKRNPNPLCRTSRSTGIANSFLTWVHTNGGIINGGVACVCAKFGDKFGESLGGSQAPPSFWKVPGLPRKFPKLPRKFFGDFPGSSLTVESNSNPEVPRRFPKLPRKFPKLPRKFPDFPGGQPLSLGSLTPFPDSQKLSLKSGAFLRIFVRFCAFFSCQNGLQKSAILRIIVQICAKSAFMQYPL